MKRTQPYIYFPCKITLITYYFNKTNDNMYFGSFQIKRASNTLQSIIRPYRWALDLNESQKREAWPQKCCCSGSDPFVCSTISHHTINCMLQILCRLRPICIQWLSRLLSHIFMYFAERDLHGWNAPRSTHNYCSPNLSIFPLSFCLVQVGRRSHGFYIDH